MQTFFRSIVRARIFELSIYAVIVTSCILIGLETYFTNIYIHATQQIILGVFVIEIALRFFARDSIKSFFCDGWNVFDLSLVIISLLPDSLLPYPFAVFSLRILRVFRILRLIRTSTELKLIVRVLIRSLSALAINAVFFMIFLYLFSVMGVTLFKLPVIDEQTPLEIAEKMKWGMRLAPLVDLPIFPEESV